MGHNLTRVTGRHLAPSFFSKSNKSPFSPLSTSPDVDLSVPFGDMAAQAIAMEKEGRNLRLKKFDDVFTSKLGGLHKRHGGPFPLDGADGYYQWASSEKFIGGVKRMMLGLNAFDDPIVHGSE